MLWLTLRWGKPCPFARGYFPRPEDTPLEAGPRRWGDRNATSAYPNFFAAGDLFDHLDLRPSTADALPDELADELLPRSITLFEHDLVHSLQEFEWQLNEYLFGSHLPTSKHTYLRVFKDI